MDKKATAEYGQKCSQAAFVLRACHKLLPTLTDRYQARQSIQLVSQPLEGRAAASQRHGRGGKGETMEGGRGGRAYREEAEVSGV